MSIEISVARILAARNDGRAEGIRYRQDQLQQLHGKVLSLQREIREALVKDSGFTAAECDTEFLLALEALREDYNSLDLKESLEDEYRVANDKSSPQHSVASGVVLIRPSRIFLFYSVITTVSAALGAGNGVILELGPTLHHLSPIIKLVLSALDRDNFVQVEQRVRDENLTQQCLLVDQQGDEDTALSARNSLQSPLRAIAVVDRTADIEVAAQWLVFARFSFCGKSPYTPTIALVNEWVKAPLLAAISRLIVKIQKHNDLKISPKDLEALAKKDIKTITVSKAGVLADVGETGLEFLQLIQDLAVPTLAIASVTSLEDAILHANVGIACANHSLNRAAYIFAAPKQAKYLCQFISTQVAYVNHIPVNHLVGPMAPASPFNTCFVPVPGHKLPLSALRTSKPLFTTATWDKLSESATLCLRDLSMSGSNVTVRHGSTMIDALLQKTLEPLKKTGQPLQMRGIGFFEQGILTGLASIGLPLLIGTGTVMFCSVRYLWQRFAQISIPR